MDCQKCGAPLTKRTQKKYCSKKCAGGATGGHPRPRRRTPRVVKVCGACGEDFWVTPYRAEKARYCSSVCYASVKGERIRGAKNPSWKGGVSPNYYLARAEKKACYVCGSTKSLDVHHRDGDNRNNDPSNWVVLCRSCHRKVHTPGRPRKACVQCGVWFRPWRDAQQFCSRGCWKASPATQERLRRHVPVMNEKRLSP